MFFADKLSSKAVILNPHISTSSNRKTEFTCLVLFEVACRLELALTALIVYFGADKNITLTVGMLYFRRPQLR